MRKLVFIVLALLFSLVNWRWV